MMRRLVFPLAAAMSLAACSTTQEVTSIRRAETPIKTVAHAADEGNSPEMDANLALALASKGVQLKATAPKGTTTANGVDAVISYVDVWRWDVVMYLQSIAVKISDAKTGELLSMGIWKDSPLHGFRDAKEAVRSVVHEALDKASPSATRPQ